MTSYTDIFGGQVVTPSDVGYNAITVSPPTIVQLQWPDVARDDDIIAARILDINSSVAGGIIRLPDATLVSTGQDFLFRNVGSASVEIQTFSGASLLTLDPGAAKYAYLTDASTPGGTWAVVAFGVGVGALDASQLAGFGLVAIGSKLNTAHPVTSNIIGDVHVLPTDRAKVFSFNGGASTVMLDTASSYGNNFFFMVSNLGSGAVTIDPDGTNTIDESASLNLNPAESALIVTDGFNWFTVGRGRTLISDFSQLVKNLTGTPNVVLTTTEATNKILKFIGTLSADTTVIVPNTVFVYEVNNSTTGAFSLTIKTATGTGIVVPPNNQQLLYSDGTDVLQAITVAVPTTGFGDGTALSPSIGFLADPDTGIFRPAANTIGFTAGGVLQGTIDTTGFHFASIDTGIAAALTEALSYAVVMG